MRITLRIDGGLAYLPGLAAPRTLDVDALPTPERKRMCDMVAAARGAPHAARAMAPRGADVRTYRVEIEDAGRVTTLELTEPIPDEHCARLVQALREHLF